MPKCVACDCDLKQSSEIVRGYCDICQRSIREVFDKDAFALGQYLKPNGSNLEWTNINWEDI